MGSSFSYSNNTTSISQDEILTNNSYTVPDGSLLVNASVGIIVTSLADSCFLDCTGLTSISITNNVTSIGSNCFLVVQV
jgi:hypothetical protein